ncbi:MAG: hypothetical protein JST59_30235 [Actinobacteria bacterium]|nr:hypothetical protein [Actinomycetota bacterium]
MSRSTTTGAERFWLDSARLAAHVISSEEELFGIDNEHEGGFAAAIAERFWQALDAEAIRGPEGVEVNLYVLGDDCLMVAVREREGQPPAPLRQVASYSLEARDVACPFDETFEECRAAIAHLLEHANGLLPGLAALRAAEARREGGEA